MNVATPSERDWIDYLEGRLGTAARESFEAWLAEHPAAEAEARELEALMADCAELPALPVPDSTLLAARAGLMAAVRQLGSAEEPLAPRPAAAPTRRRSDRFRIASWMVPVAAAAALILGVLIGRQPGTLLLPDGATPAIGLQPAGYVDGSGTSDLLTTRSRHVAVQDLDVEAGQEVRILLNETSSYEVNGPASSSRIQGYLSYILRNDADPARRSQAISLLEKHCDGDEVCSVLVYAMTQDPSAAVRQAAAGALSDDSADPLVRQSFFKMAVEDPAPELRELAAKVLDAGNLQELGR